MPLETRRVQEGKVKVDIPIIKDDVPRKNALVFYNPVQELNRDFSVLVIRVYSKMKDSNISICEPFCGSGIRGIRYFSEVEGISRLVLNDINPEAVKITNSNLKLNKNLIPDSSKVVVLNEDAIGLLMEGGRKNEKFNVVDIDPFGSPSRFFQAGILALKKTGLLCCTATDLSVLVGKEGHHALYRKYGAHQFIRPSGYCHETAARLLIGSVQREAAKFKLGLYPLLTLYANHYIRIFLQLGSTPTSILQDTGYICECPVCSIRTTQRLTENSSCKTCGELLETAGPLWLGPLHRENIISEMSEELEKVIFDSKNRVTRILDVMKREVGVSVPWFYNIHQIAKKAGTAALSTEAIIKILIQKGFQAAPTHFCGECVKTDAQEEDLAAILAETH